MSTFILDSLSFRVLGQCADTPTLMGLIYSVTDFPEFLPTQLKNGMTVNPACANTLGNNKSRIPRGTLM